MEKKRALITGITGQVGSYLAEFLLTKDYDVQGMYRRTSSNVEDRIPNLIRRIELIEGDLTDTSSLMRVIEKVQPDEVYNLAAQSFVPRSWSDPESTADITGLGALRILEAIRRASPKSKFYQASSSEMFGKTEEFPQNEQTRFHPRSPYAVSKVFAHNITVNYRESYNLFACGGILFNHESPRRGIEFVTRKITDSVARIKLEIPQRINGKDYLELGNLDAKRDWGFAGDYVEAMWLMLQQAKPNDYVISTEENHSIREFVEESFKVVGMSPIVWNGKGIKEVGECNGKTVVKINPEFYRPAEVNLLLGDSSKARIELGWKPKVNFKELVKMMVESDYSVLKGENL